MLVAGLLLRNIPVVTEAVYINFKWSTSLRNIALAVILTRAGLGLDASVCQIFPCSAHILPGQEFMLCLYV